MNDDKKVSRRNVLKSSLFAGFAGLLATANPIKIFSADKKVSQNKLKVKIHPLAVKRNNKDKS